MHRLPTILMVLSISLVTTVPASGQVIWYVDDDAPYDPGPGNPTVSDPDEDGSAEHPFDAIQEGIDAALDGDEVVIQDGTYTGDGNRDLDFGGKAITVRSANGDPNLCIIDCEGAARGLCFCYHETALSVVDGITITNGYDDGDGGAIYCLDAAPTITNCVISYNYAAHRGGGVCCEQADPAISNCTISQNTAYEGGGVCVDGGSPTITSCDLSGNTALGYGGGIEVWQTSGTLVLSQCTVLSNTAEHYGGGLCYAGGSFLISECVLSNNQASQGGAIHCNVANQTIVNCTISDNVSDDDGGGVYCDGGSSAIIDCDILGNTAVDRGGGIHCEEDSPTIVSCTFAGNAADSGGGVCCRESNPCIQQNVFQSNTAGRGSGLYCEYNSTPHIARSLFSYNSSCQSGAAVECSNSATVINNCTIAYNHTEGQTGGVLCQYRDLWMTNCIAWGNAFGQVYAYAGEAVISHSDINGILGGEGNLDTDPLFVDPDGADGVPGTEDDDLRLLPNSPCIDAGDPESEFRFEPEPDGGRVNMGAYGNTPEAATRGWLYITGYRQVSKRRVGRTVFEYELKLTIENVSTDDASNVLAELLDMPEGVTIVENQVFVGDLPAGQSVTPDDTFALRVDRALVIDPFWVSWRVEYTRGGRSEEGTFGTWLDLVNVSPDQPTAEIGPTVLPEGPAKPLPIQRNP